MEAVCPSEMSVIIYQMTWRNITEDLNRHQSSSILNFQTGQNCSHVI